MDVTTFVSRLTQKGYAVTVIGRDVSIGHVHPAEQSYGAQIRKDIAELLPGATVSVIESPVYGPTGSMDQVSIVAFVAITGSGGARGVGGPRDTSASVARVA